MIPKTIAVDFDGTICDSSFPNNGPVMAGAKEALQKFRDLGYRIIIYSCRTCHWHYDIFGGSRSVPTLEREHVKSMIEWLNLYEIPYDIIDDGSNGKPVADFYIDDRALRFENNWSEIQNIVHHASLMCYTKEVPKE